MLKRLTIAGCALGASLAVAAPAMAAGPTEYVNPNGSDTTASGAPNTCRLPKSPCLTIQHAVDVAPGPATGPGTGTIKVASGVYDEQVTVDGKNLTITGAGIGKTIIDPDIALNQTTNDPNHPGTPQADIVTFEHASSGGLSALSVEGGDDLQTDGNVDYVGVYFYDASGALKTVAVDGVQHNAATFGSQPGANGDVYVANDATDGSTYSVTMSAVKATNYDKNGITCRNVGTSCTITGSAVTGSGPLNTNAQNGIEIYGASAATITGTKVSQNSYRSPSYSASNPTYYNASGVLLINDGTIAMSGDTVTQNDENVAGVEDPYYAAGPAAGAWSITRNTLSQATNDTGSTQGTTAVPNNMGIGDGIDLYGVSQATVLGNTLGSEFDEGIGLYGVSNSTIGDAGKGDANTITKAGDNGIYLGEYTYGDNSATVPSTNNTIEANKVSGSVNDGILAGGPDSSGAQQVDNNTFSANVLTGNQRYDAEDLSTGGGTSGTADTWVDQQCQPKYDANPEGLCSATSAPSTN